MKLYSSRSNWFQHELSVHRRAWRCQICGQQDASRSGFYEHLRRHDSGLTEEQLYVFAEMWEEHMELFSLSAYPLCGGSAGGVSPDPSSSSAGQPDAIREVTARQFEVHLGRHLEELALLDLPIYAVSEAGEGLGGNLTQERSQAGDSSSLSGELPEKLRELKVLPVESPDRPSKLHECSDLLLVQFIHQTA